MKHFIIYVCTPLFLFQVLLLQNCGKKEVFKIDVVKESKNYTLISMPPEWVLHNTFKAKNPGDKKTAIGQKWDDELILLDTREFRITEFSELQLIKDPEPKLEVNESDKDLTIFFNNRLLSRFHTYENIKEDVLAEFKRSGFIHPFMSPKGMMLTDDFPVGHRHQHGIFGALTRTTHGNDTIDFWNQGKKIGNVHLEQLENAYNGPLFLEINALLHYTKFNTLMTLF